MENKTRPKTKSKTNTKNKLLDKINKSYEKKVKNFELSSSYKELTIKILSKKENKIGIFKKDKLLLVGEFNFYGIYQPNTNLFIWGNSIPGVSRNIIKNINQIKNANYLFESDNNKDISLYYQLLTQDILLIPEENIRDINKLLLYLSENIMIFNPIFDNNIQFIGLSKIVEKYY
jgi:hypothetical protein